MKEPVALLINDLHANKDNLAEFKKNLDEALDLCLHYRIGDVVIGGDVFTSRSSQNLSILTTVKNCLENFTRQNIIVTIAEGNHDKQDSNSNIGYNHLWIGLKHIEVVDQYSILIWDGCDFALLVLSYFPENGSFLEILNNAVEGILRNEANTIKSKTDIILYIHEGVHGALGDFEIEMELPQEPLLGFRAVLCGHYHNRCRIKGTNIEYIGSSRQHNFGEDEEKGYTILYSDGSYEFVKNEVNTRYRTVVVNADELDNLSLDNDPRYKNKVKVKCTEQQAKTFDKQKFMDLGFDKVEVVAESIVPEEVAASAIQEKYDTNGIKKEYQNYCDENSIDSKLGIKYLEGVPCGN